LKNPEKNNSGDNLVFCKNPEKLWSFIIVLVFHLFIFHPSGVVFQKTKVLHFSLKNEKCAHNE